MKEKTDLRIIKTHKALCEAFAELLETKSFEDITVNELCDKALVRRPTFYKHFADKYDFFAYYVRCIGDSFALKYDENAHENSYFDYMFEHALDFFEANMKMVNNIQNSTVFSSLTTIICEEIQRNIYLMLKSQLKEEQPSELSLTIISNYMAGGISQLFRYWIKNRDSVSREMLRKDVSFATDIALWHMK